MNKRVYPIVLIDEGTGFYVEIPDFDIATQGTDLADAISMARDAIGLMGIDMIDDGKELPVPNSVDDKIRTGDICTLVDVDFVEYRRRVDNKAVKKNCTIPYWLSVEAERAGLNYSKILQEAIVKTLNLKRKY